MSIRVLEQEEYERLLDTEIGEIPPEGSIVVVDEDSKGIAGRMLLVPLPHVEGVWLRPDMKGSGSLGRIERFTEKWMKENIPMPFVFAYATNSTMEGYLSRLGYVKQELTVWKKEL